MQNYTFTNKDIEKLKTKDQLLSFLSTRDTSLDKILARIQYEKDLQLLQIELLKFQNWVLENNKRVVIIFEGRDAAGKGGAIRRFQKYLNPRSSRVVALGKPSEIEKGQWYFRRHVKELPQPGEIVFFDRSWYNRAVVEPVMGFCLEDEYNRFMSQVTEFEHMLYEDGVDIIKFWFSITADEQKKRFASRKTNPLKQWKLSPVDIKAQGKWNEFSHYIRQMFLKTHTEFSPWVIIDTDEKPVARLESIRYILSHFNYTGKDRSDAFLFPDLDVLHRYRRSLYLNKK